MGLGFFWREADYRDFQVFANHSGDLAHGNAFLRHGVITGARCRCFKRKPVEPRYIGDVRRRPALVAIADVRPKRLYRRPRE